MNTNLNFKIDTTEDTRIETQNHQSQIHVNPQKETTASIILPTHQIYTPDVDLATLSIKELATSEIVYNRELNWLDFNWRVLNEALDTRTPLLERLKFLAITSSNLDEFFSKRVGGLKRQKAAGIANLTLSGWTPERQLGLIAQAVRPMVETQSDCLINEILPALADEGVEIKSYDDLDATQKEKLRNYYHQEVYPILTPLAVDPGRPFPHLSTLSLSLGVTLQNPDTGDTHFARIKVPENRPRWIPLKNSGQDNLNHFVPLEEVITHNLDTLFPGMEIVAAYTFRVTRNADIARNEEEADDLLAMINEELRERAFAPVVRLEVAESMSEEMCQFLQTELNLDDDDIYRIRGPLGLSDCFSLMGMNLPHIKDAPWTPMTPPRLSGLDSRSRPSEIFSVIRQGDILVHHPYHSFATTTQQFIESAARDPQVLALKQTLYRTSDDSPVIDALIHAAANGKQVIVLVEVKARFDEARNIAWARTLEDAGCHVAYGLVGLKTHSKLSLVIREEDRTLRTYFHIGTGNYNAKTAGLYTDMGLLSCREDLGKDLMDLFNHLTGYSLRATYRKLLVAPVNMRQRFIELIEQEIAHAQVGEAGYIIAKMNGLEDPKLVRKLYEASQAGVRIDLIVRGNCRIRPGLSGISENIRVRSVIGRFLEHPRIFYFDNNGEPQCLIGSADWMERNLSYRVEAVVPVEDKRLQQQILESMQVSLEDQRQAWDMLPDGRYQQAYPSADDDNVAAIGTQAAVLQQVARSLSQMQKKE
ncbi:MAG: polyphosphate kinase 1 [Chloroflexota bacterium]